MAEEQWYVSEENSEKAHNMVLEIMKLMKSRFILVGFIGEPKQPHPFFNFSVIGEATRIEVEALFEYLYEGVSKSHNHQVGA